MARLINPEPYKMIYDPACGSGGLLIKPRLLFAQTHPDEKSQAPQIYGQELTPTTYAMAKMNRLPTRFYRRGYSDWGHLPQPAFHSSVIHRSNVLITWLRIRCGIKRSMTTLFTRATTMEPIFGRHRPKFLSRLGMGTAYTRLSKRRADAQQLCWIPVRSLAGPGVSTR